ncbi:MAG: hypothetical protein WDM81_01650 [Rhizomicrobium sp.]
MSSGGGFSGWWHCNSTDYYNAAGFLTFFVGLIAAITAVVTYRSSNRAQKVQNEAILFQNAVQIYRRYLELAIQYPRFAEPDDYPPPKTDEEREGMNGLLGCFLRACEEVLQYVGGANEERQKEWTRITRSLLNSHGRYFALDRWWLTKASSSIHLM